MRRLAVSIALLLAALASTSCRYARTQIVLRVETDIDQGPGRTLTAVRVVVHPSDFAQPARLDRTYPLGVAVPSPDSGVENLPLLSADLGIAARNNDGTRTVAVEIIAMRDTVELFTYRTIAPFEQSQTTILRVFLADRCRVLANREICESRNESCGPNGCEAIRRESLPRLDASTEGGTMDATQPETGLDVAEAGIDAVDGAADVMDVLADGGCPAGQTECSLRCVDTQTNPDHCGMCGRNCPNVTNGAAGCVGGVCGVRCDTGFHECGGLCVSVSAVSSCGMRCTPCPDAPRSVAVCTSGACDFTCDANYDDCNPGVAGCESYLGEAANCGACGNVCPAAAPNCTFTAGAFRCEATCVAGGPCPFSEECVSGVIGCPGGMARCQAGPNRSAGTSCSMGRGVCDGAGACVLCLAGSACSPANDCVNGSRVCTTFPPTCMGGSPLLAGTACNTNGGNVCNGSGACVACNAGAACPTGNECTVGAIGCDSGAPVCNFTMNRPSGTSCSGTGTCNGLGSCSVCTGGMACSTSNECLLGMTNCLPDGGVDCEVSGPAPVGTSCMGGAGNCDGAGSCNTCMSGEPCSGPTCVESEIRCMGTMPFCSPQRPAPAGVPCPGGVCNGSGTCVCEASCSGRECGSDGCGGSCGMCSGGETCDASGLCVGLADGGMCMTTPCDFNECMAGMTSCDGGMCLPTGPQNVGLPCGGSGMFCSASGVCEFRGDSGRDG